MSMLKKASNNISYSKTGIYGEAGSGKSRTAAEIAVGLIKTHKLEKPIGIFDTEPAWSFLLPFLGAQGMQVPYIYDESRAFKDVMAWVDEAQEACSVLIIDSVSHLWKDLQESYLARINDQRRNNNKRPLGSLEFQHWGPIKRQWADFTDVYLSSKVHFIVCGRAGNVYEYQDKDDGSGKKELITVGTKMQTEKEMGYEPSLLIEMIKEHEGGKIVNTAFIQKDRADKLNGQLIQMPTFEKLRGHYDAINAGGAHFSSMRGKDSREMFTEDGEDNFGAEIRRREVALDEIREEILKHHGHGQDAATKAAKSATLESIAGTRSWEKLGSSRVNDVIVARNKLWNITRGHDYGAQVVPQPEPETIGEDVP
jgi:hypothetical protein